jgi:homoserine O-acetyltransferase
VSGTTVSAGPVTGAWRPGDPPGRRHFAYLEGGLDLEAGGHLPSVTVAYETWGELDTHAGNAVLVMHALSGDSHVAGPVEPGHPSRGWWGDMVGPGRPIDTDRYYVVCPNVLGGCQGTTGPSSQAPDEQPYGSRFPTITIKDQVAVERSLAAELGIARWHAVTGGSMGGMRALQWCVDFPGRVERAIVVATGAAASAEQIALCSLQVRAIRLDPDFHGGDYYGAERGPLDGLAIARGIGHVSYRSELEMEIRFGNLGQQDETPLAGGRYAVESYLDHHGDKLIRRFDANTYIALSEAMNHHDIGRGHGGAAEALRHITAEVTVGGISSDRLYPLRLQEEIVRFAPHAGEVQVIDSIVGHDGFLVESEAVGNLISAALRS